MKFLSVFGWSLLMTIPIIGLLYSLSFFGALQPGPNTGGSMEGVAMLIGVAGLGFSTLVFFVCYKAKPASEAFSTANSLISAIVALACIALAWVLPRSGFERTLTIVVRDSATRPVAGVELTYSVSRSRPLVGGITTIARGSTMTDAHGMAMLQAGRRCTLSAVLLKEGYRRTGFAIQEETPQEQRDYEIWWDRSDRRSGENGNRVTGHWTARQEQTIVVYLAGKSDGNTLPYDLSIVDVIWPPR